MKIPCPLPMVTFWNQLTTAPNTSCTAWKKWAIGRINQFDPSVVVVTTEDWDPQTATPQPMSQTEYSSGLVTTLRDLSKSGRQVVLLGDIAYQTTPGPVCLAAHESNVAACNTPTSIAVVASSQAAEADAAKKAGIKYINVVPWLCTPKFCPTIIDGIDVYEDEFHITTTFGEWLEPVLAEALGLAKG